MRWRGPWCDVLGATNQAILVFPNAIVPALVEGEGDTAVIEMVNNRKYPMILVSEQPVAWSWSDEPSGVGDSVTTAVIAEMLPENAVLPAAAQPRRGPRINRGDWFFAGVEAHPTKLAVAATFVSMVLDKLGSEIAERSYGMVGERPAATTSSASSTCRRTRRT